MSASRVRVLIVDDSAFIRRAVERMLTTVPEIEVVGTASNGRDGVDRACELRPDVVIMDIRMPRMDGIEAIRKIMAECPCKILILSTLAQAGADITLRGLELGAVDFVDKTQAGSTMDIHELAPIVREKVLALGGAELPTGSALAPEVPEPSEPESDHAPAPHGSGPYDLVAIGASTGGPRALFEILPRLPAGFPAGLVIAQHMPAAFTTTLADRLDRRSAIQVREAQDGDRIRPGLALLAPGGRQIEVGRVGDDLCVRVRDADGRLLHHPSIDILLSSTAASVGKRAIGIVLTGMGEDGARGLQRVRAAGGRTLVESAATAVIYGMPRAALVSAERELPLGQIAPVLIGLCAGRPAREGDGGS